MRIQNETIVPASQAYQTITLKRDYGSLVVDVWEPRTAAKAPPVLLIHGWGASGFYWHKTAQALAATVRVIVPDLPGTGRSLPVRKTRNMFDQVAALIELLDELGVEQVQVIGHSMGGAMALLLADAQPERVKRLVLTSTCFFLDEQQIQVYEAIMKFTFLTMRFRPSWLVDLPFMTRLTATHYFYRVPDEPALLRQGFQDYLHMDYTTAVACANDAGSPSIPAAGRRVRVPTLLIACRQDRVMPRGNVDYTVSAIPGCKAQWIDACGHLPMVEKPEEYEEILRGFLALGTDE